MLHANSANVSWDTEKKQWNVRVQVGAEVIRRPLPKTPETAAEEALRSLAVDTAKDEGYDLDPGTVAVTH
jgi:hypothetical protein